MKYKEPSSIIDIAAVGLDRYIKEYQPHPDGKIVNLGAGNKVIEGTEPLDQPDWRAGEPMPYRDESVGAIYAFHFFEHLWEMQITQVLHEVERVLTRGGMLYTLIPHWSGEAAHQDLNHKSFWSESTWKNLLENPYYKRELFKLTEVQSILIGVVQRNLCILSQIRKNG